MAEIADIISKLLERSNEGKVSWRRPIDDYLLAVKEKRPAVR